MVKSPLFFHRVSLRYQHLPILRILLPFAAGILSAYRYGEVVHPVVLIGGTVVMGGLAWWVKGKASMGFQVTAFGLLGAAWYLVRCGPPKEGVVSAGKGKAVILLDEKVKVSDYFETYRGKVWCWQPETKKGREVKGAETVLVRFPRGKGPEEGVYVMEAYARALFKGDSPFWINWNRRKWPSIRHVLYPRRWAVAATEREGVIVRWRRFLDGALAQVLSGDALKLGRAILLGIREGMDSRLREGFVRAGAVHVLAISGLHVGIIYLPLAWLLRRWRYGRWLRWLRLVLMAVVLGGYAALTGFSPSVVRAALMFFLFGMALSVERDQWSLNTALVSFFLMLVIQPAYLLDAGFQLSYAAVMGIIVFVGIWRRWVAFSSGWVQWAVMLMMMSAAAVLSTAPLVIYYFGKLPLYSVLSSLMVIPLVTVVVYVGLAYLLAYSLLGVGVWSELLGMVLLYALRGLKAASFWVSSWRGAMWEGLYLSDVEMMLGLLLVVMSAVVFYYIRRWEAWVGLWLVLAVYGTVRTVRKWRVMSHPRGAWVAVSSGMALVVPNGRRAVVFLHRAAPDEFVRRHRRMLDSWFVKKVVFRSFPERYSDRLVMVRRPLWMVGKQEFQVHVRGDRWPWVEKTVITLSSRKRFRRMSMAPFRPLWREERIVPQKALLFPLSIE